MTAWHTFATLKGTAYKAASWTAADLQVFDELLEFILVRCSLLADFSGCFQGTVPAPQICQLSPEPLIFLQCTVAGQKNRRGTDTAWSL